MKAVYNDVLVSRGACKCQVLRNTVCYWQRQTADAYGSLDDPCFIKCTGSNPHVYALPALEYPQLVKVRQTSLICCADSLLNALISFITVMPFYVMYF